MYFGRSYSSKNRGVLGILCSLLSKLCQLQLSLNTSTCRLCFNWDGFLFSFDISLLCSS